MNAKENVIIDCDPGIDDSLALMMVLAGEKLNVMGITVVCGNVPVKEGVQNVFRVLERMNRMDIAVYAGEEKPLIREYVSAQDTHGMDGLGESGYPVVPGRVQPKGAVSYLVETLRSGLEVSILALGPLTNLAKAVEQDSECFTGCRRCVSMGGNYKSFGNCSPVAEYNYWCDPHGASLVYENFSRLGKSIHMVGLDVTRKIVLTPNIIAYMKRLDAKLGKFVEEITGFYMDFHWKQEKIIGCVINDPLAAAYFMNPHLCSGFEAYTAIETEGITMGQSVVDEQGFYGRQPNSLILTQVDSLEFMKEFLVTVFGGEPDAVLYYLRQLGGYPA